ncbi:hypothetical protein QFC21_001635 [Naganishia friedmannii]|uniref:Uncharacterized protein n=1 Tax=Naganishia friedmannii TaxID=89922 RepID=A0ACC2W1G8_9TREE|nr:hypothetical protein QFC21_001635 [Naganishia friedmannii]
MFNPTRGGTRGGAAEFKWNDVKADKDRENYLGHSINAPQGRWQNHKDIHWYNRNKSGEEDAEALRKQKARELKEIKMREENELSIALGYGALYDVDNLNLDSDEDQGPSKAGGVKTEKELELEQLEAEEKRRRKELKREKKAMKEIEKKIKKQEKEERRTESKGHRIRDREEIAAVAVVTEAPVRAVHARLKMIFIAVRMETEPVDGRRIKKNAVIVITDRHISARKTQRAAVPQAATKSILVKLAQLIDAIHYARRRHHHHQEIITEVAVITTLKRNGLGIDRDGRDIMIGRKG